MAHEPGVGERHIRATGGRLWQLLPVDWGKIQEVTNEPVPGHIKRWWFALGGTPAYLFLIQITTGILLSFYYVPSPDHAYDSVAAITHAVPFGWFVRSIHKWAANLMIITVLLHMCRVFFSCGFRHPRQVNWVVGCGLLLCTLSLGFTGYSLIQEQLSYWGITVASELVSNVPLLGPTLANFMRGGEEIGPNTLTRMFNLHVGILPVVTILLIGLHVAVLRLHGVSDLSFTDPRLQPGNDRLAKSLPGVRLMALLAALGAVGCILAAAFRTTAITIVATDLSVESTRLLCLIVGGLLATASALLAQGHMYGLLLWLAISILAIAKLIFDLTHHEAIHVTGWIVMVLVLGVTAVYGVVRQDRFIEGKGVDKPFNFFPDHIITELLIGTLLLFLLTLMTLVFPAELAERANPLVTPDHIKPEWYFFFQFRMLKLTGLNTAVVMSGALVLMIVLWPWIDSLLERIAPRKDLGIYIGIVAFLAFLTFTVWEAMV
ncbi:MAG: cytochrome b N-terminal domain-containing protein [Planctomycetota bacterium]